MFVLTFKAHGPRCVRLSILSLFGPLKASFGRNQVLFPSFIESILLPSFIESIPDKNLMISSFQSKINGGYQNSSECWGCSDRAKMMSNW